MNVNVDVSVDLNDSMFISRMCLTGYLQYPRQLHQHYSVRVSNQPGISTHISANLGIPSGYVKIAIENGRRFFVIFPMKNGIFHSYVNVYRKR